MARLPIVACVIVALCAAAGSGSYRHIAGHSATGNNTILKASEITPSIFPERVFYEGKTGPTEMRNTGGVRFADGSYFLAGLVDTAGYSTAVNSKYEAYLLTEVPLRFGDRGEYELKPGAYGAGFVSETFVVSDLGAHDLFRVAAHHDTAIKRPIPLEVLAGSASRTYRLYRGRDYVEFRRAP